MKAKQSTILKLTAGILATILLLCAAACVALWAVAQAGNFGTSTYAYIEDEVLQVLVRDQLGDVFHTYRRGDDPTEVYEHTNLIFQLFDEDGNLLAQSRRSRELGDQAYELECAVERFVDSGDTGTDPAVSTEDTTGAQLEPSPAETTAAADELPPVPEEEPVWVTERYTLRGDIDREFVYTDRYSVILGLLKTYYSMHRSLLFIAAGCALLWLVLLIWLMSAAGHHRGEDAPRRGWLEYVPFDLLVLGIVLWICLHWILGDIGDLAFVVGAPLFAAADAILITLTMTTTAVRLKTHTLLKTTLVWVVLVLALRLLRWFLRGIRRIFGVIGGALGVAFGSVPLVWKTALGVLANGFFDLLAALGSRNVGTVFLFILVKDMALGVMILFCAVLMRRIQAGGERLAAGDLAAKIDTRTMFGDFREFSENMNRLGDGMSAAVEERMKSERFRTELITNVSHDIKTPLTSIVNYVDLIKKENVTEEPLAGYVAVLDRQSARLKKLTEDLIEASKAATGSIAVHPEALDVTVLLGQTAGEYDEKLRGAGLDLILHQPGEPVMITADGRLLWRVFDNLMNNIVKYALPGTRVYLTLNVRETAAEILFRNIARDELNVESEELLNRFTRGDASRSTEGSGLGLSIAKSLTELQGGELALSVDGDLFKVQLRFPLA